VTEFKLVAALFVLFAGVGGGVLASRLLGEKARHDVAALANTFAGRVFLGAAFLHVLPDAIGNFNIWLEAFDYPLFALAASGGFLTVLLLDKVIGPTLASAAQRGAMYPYILMLTLSVHSVICRGLRHYGCSRHLDLTSRVFPYATSDSGVAQGAQGHAQGEAEDHRARVNRAPKVHP